MINTIRVLALVLTVILVIVSLPMTALRGRLVRDLRDRLLLAPAVIRSFGIVELVAVAGILIGFWNSAVGLVASLATAPLFIGASIHQRRSGILNDADYRLLATAPVVFAVLPIAAGPLASVLQVALDPRTRRGNVGTEPGRQFKVWGA